MGAGGTFLTLALALIGSTALAVRYGLRPLRVLREGVAAIRRGEAEHIDGRVSAGRRAARGRGESADRLQSRDRRAGPHPGRQPRPCAQDPAQRADQRGRLGEPRSAGKGARADRDHAPAGDVLSRPGARRGARPDRGPVDRGEAGRRGAWSEPSRNCTPNRASSFTADLQEGLKFRGEAQDLTDLIGNLLDNAGKWARETVSIRARRAPAANKDAGAVPDRGNRRRRARDSAPVARAEAIERGKRLDESRPGSGLGLVDRRRPRVDLRRLAAARRKPARGPRAILRLPCV